MHTSNDWFYEYFINELKAIRNHSKCEDGKSAYDYAVESGYTGTEAEFAEKMASEAMIVRITDNNGTLSADKTFLEIWNAIIAGTPVLVWYDDSGLPLIAADNNALYFGTVMCDNGDDVNGAAVGSITIEIAQNGEVNDLSAQANIPKTLPNPNALTFTGAVTGSYDGSAPLSVKIPSGDAMIVEITDNGGALSADKTFTEIMEAINAGTTVLVYYNGCGLPLISISDNSLHFGLFSCVNADDVDPAAVSTSMIEITGNGEVNDLSTLIFIPSVPSKLPNPNALTFTGAVTGRYDGSRPKTVNIPSAVTDDHINSLIDAKLGVIENGSY